MMPRFSGERARVAPRDPLRPACGGSGESGFHNPRNLDDTVFAIDVHVNDNRRVHSDRLVTRVRKATSALAITLRARGPACPCGRGFDDGTSPRILQMREAESDGIEPSCFGEFVHKGFDGEDVAVGAQRPERSVADWSVKEEVIPDLL